MYLPCHGFLSRLNMADERMSELKDISTKAKKKWKAKRTKMEKTE